MLNNALLVHKDTYAVPKGQEHHVHYKIAKLTSDGSFIERPRICISDPKIFESVMMTNLPTMGYTIEILFHPNGKYTSTIIEDRNVVMADKDAEIARLKAQIAEMEANPKVAEPKPLATEPKAEPIATETKKVGRPGKED